MQRRDAGRRAVGGYESVPRTFDAPPIQAPVHTFTESTQPAAPAPLRGKGMSLGKKKGGGLVGAIRKELNAPQAPVQQTVPAAAPAPVLGQAPMATPAPSTVPAHAPAPTNEIDLLGDEQYEQDPYAQTNAFGAADAAVDPYAQANPYESANAYAPEDAYSQQTDAYGQPNLLDEQADLIDTGTGSYDRQPTLENQFAETHISKPSEPFVHESEPVAPPVLSKDIAVPTPTAPAPAPAPAPVPAPAPAPVAPAVAPELPTAAAASTPQPVHLTVRERVTATGNRDGGLSSLEVKGDLLLKVTDPALARMHVHADLTGSLLGGAEPQYRTHPHVDKQAWADDQTIALRDPNRPFPLGQQVGVLRWRVLTRDETVMPLSLTVWTSPTGDGGCEVNVEYELENDALELYNVVVAVPLPAGAEASVGEPEVGSQHVDASGRLVWTIGAISAAQPNGNLEFSVASGGDDVNVFFPVSIDFTSNTTLAGVAISSVVGVDGTPLPYSAESQLLTDGFLIQ